MDPSRSSSASSARSNDAEPIPFGQRFFDSMYLLLAIGVLIMLVVFTSWGLYEILSMPKGTLP
jgi:hypothetical protein